MGRRCFSSMASRSSGSPGATRWPRSPPAGSARSPPTSAATASPPSPTTPPPTPSSTSSATSSRSLTISNSQRCSLSDTTGEPRWRGLASLPVPAGPGACRRRTGGTVLPSTPSADDGGLRGVWRWLLHDTVPGAWKS